MRRLRRGRAAGLADGPPPIPTHHRCLSPHTTAAPTQPPRAAARRPAWPSSILASTRPTPPCWRGVSPLTWCFLSPCQRLPRWQSATRSRSPTPSRAAAAARCARRRACLAIRTSTRCGWTTAAWRQRGSGRRGEHGIRRPAAGCLPSPPRLLQHLWPGLLRCAWPCLVGSGDLLVGSGDLLVGSGDLLVGSGDLLVGPLPRMHPLADPGTHALMSPACRVLAQPRCWRATPAEVSGILLPEGRQPGGGGCARGRGGAAAAVRGRGGQNQVV